MKSCGGGGAPVSVELINHFEQVTGVPIVEGYGLSGATIAAIRTPKLDKRKIGSCRIPLPNTEAKIVDIETGKIEMTMGEPGEIIVKGPQVMKG
ncbi:AMP-binding protein [Bacillus sp. JJ722]|uniref:AMP-binding protein n=1 Tax=Bacillus sp. JJ722 TaxID=3122973 RepID=UPI0030006A66